MSGYLQRLADRTGLGRTRAGDAAAEAAAPLAVEEVVQVATAPSVPSARPAPGLPAAPPAPPAGLPPRAAPEPVALNAHRSANDDLHAAAPAEAPASGDQPRTGVPPVQSVPPRTRRRQALPAPASPGAARPVAPSEATSSLAAPAEAKGETRLPTLPAAVDPAINDLSERLVRADPAIVDLSERLFRAGDPQAPLRGERPASPSPLRRWEPPAGAPPATARALPLPAAGSRPPARAERRPPDAGPSVHIGSIRVDVRTPQPAPQPLSPPPPPRPSRGPLPLRRFHLREW